MLVTPLSTAISIEGAREKDTDDFKSETLGDPCEVITFIRGKYDSLREEYRYGRNYLIITCKPGDIIFWGFRIEDSSLTMFNFYYNNQATNIGIQDRPNFRGYCRN